MKIQEQNRGYGSGDKSFAKRGNDEQAVRTPRAPAIRTRQEPEAVAPTPEVQDGQRSFGSSPVTPRQTSTPTVSPRPTVSSAPILDTSESSAPRRIQPRRVEVPVIRDQATVRVQNDLHYPGNENSEYGRRAHAAYQEAVSASGYTTDEDADSLNKKGNVWPLIAMILGIVLLIIVVSAAVFLFFGPEKYRKLLGISKAKATTAVMTKVNPANMTAIATTALAQKTEPERIGPPVSNEGNGKTTQAGELEHTEWIFTVPGEPTRYGVCLLTNKSKNELALEVRGSFKKAGVVSVEQMNRVDVLGPGQKTVLLFITADAVEDFTVNLSTLAPNNVRDINAGIKSSVKQFGNAVEITLKNENSFAAEDVDAYALFFANNKLIYADRNSFVDASGKLPQGASVTKNIGCPVKYDKVEVYVKGFAKK